MSDLKHPYGDRFKDTFSVKPRDSKELVFTRSFEAPLELVWKALTTREHIPHWWGPHAAETTVDFMDVRVGGTWRFICTEPTGTYAFRGEYLELSPPSRLVQTFEFEGVPGIMTETTTLTERDGRVDMVVVSLFATQEDRDGAMEFVEGSQQSWERLAALLETLREA